MFPWECRLKGDVATDGCVVRCRGRIHDGVYTESALHNVKQSVLVISES